MNHGDTKAQRGRIPEEINLVASQVVDAVYTVHIALGPGLLESVYEVCLDHELKKRGLNVKRQLTLPVIYDGISVDAGLRLDMLVNDCLILELKTVESLLPVHKAQLITYLKLTGLRLGLLINFNTPVIKEGIKRIAL